MQGTRSGAASLLLTSAAAATLVSAPVLAEQRDQHLYVSSTGSDANRGTAQEPFRTIPRAAHAATPGTTVHVASGVYDGGFKTVASGSATAAIQYLSDEKWGAKLVPADGSAAEVAWDNRGDYVTIEGFEVDGTTTRSDTPWRIGIYAAGSHDIVAHNHVLNIGRGLPCTSHGGSGIGTDHYYYGVDNNVIGNVVHHIGPAGCRFYHGIYISTSGNVVNNLVYDIAAGGIHLWHDANHVNVVNNTVARNTVGILVGGGDQYHSKEPNDYTNVVNNIVVRNRMAGIEEHGNTGMHNIYLSNLVWENGRHNYRLQNGLKDNRTVRGDPKFRKDGTDFRLMIGSPAIDAGDSSFSPSVDANSTSRPHGDGYEIGAYEYEKEN
jgi:hypothetical protein